MSNFSSKLVRLVNSSCHQVQRFTTRQKKPTECLLAMTPSTTIPPVQIDHRLFRTILRRVRKQSSMERHPTRRSAIGTLAKSLVRPRHHLQSNSSRTPRSHWHLSTSRSKSSLNKRVRGRSHSQLMQLDPILFNNSIRPAWLESTSLLKAKKAHHFCLASNSAYLRKPSRIFSLSSMQCSELHALQ